MTKATFVIQNVGPMSCRPITWLKHVETPSKSRYIKIYPPYILVSLLIKPMEHHIVGDFGRYHIFLSTSLPPFYPIAWSTQNFTSNESRASDASMYC
jgi:hypothetical protein